jgi:3-methyladenine DNA glycosylase AlkD
MTITEVLAMLESMGTARNRTVYARHGYPADTYGVSFANLRSLARKIGTDHALARDLWASRNGDAQVLALMVGDPAAMSARDLDRWASEVTFYVVADLFSGFAARSPLARRKCEQWMEAPSDFLGQMGWNLCGILTAPEHGIADPWFQDRLDHIEAHIHAAPNRTRHAMNMALCAIGGYRATLRRAAVSAARRIGRVEVDHGETGCKTPDAVAYIDRIAARVDRRAPAAPATKTARKAAASAPARKTARKAAGKAAGSAPGPERAGKVARKASPAVGGRASTAAPARRRTRRSTG